MNGNVYFVTIHFLLDCDFYSDLRYALTENACILFENFENLILEDKFIFIMSNQGRLIYVLGQMKKSNPFIAKTLYNMFYRRKYCLQ